METKTFAAVSSLVPGVVRFSQATKARSCRAARQKALGAVCQSVRSAGSGLRCGENSNARKQAAIVSNGSTPKAHGSFQMAVSSSCSSLVAKFPSAGLRFGTEESLVKDSLPGFRVCIRKPDRLIVSAVRELTGHILKGEGLRFAVVAARFNEIVTRPLVTGALETFHKYAVKDEDVDLVWVPGSFEIPLVAQQMAKSGRYDAVLAIGAVIRGATTHYDAVAGSAASGLMSAGLNSGIPVVFGILTTENMEQALDRAGGKVGNKGAEAALTAIEMASLFKHQILPLQ